MQFRPCLLFPLRHAILAPKAALYGSEVSAFSGDHRDRELN